MSAGLDPEYLINALSISKPHSFGHRFYGQAGSY